MMKTLLALMFVAIVIQPKTYLVKRVNDIQVDGSLKEWPNKNWLNFSQHTGKETQSKGQFQIAKGDSGIYFCFQIQDHFVSFSEHPHDAMLWKTDEIVEIFIDEDGDGENYVELGINPLGNYYDMLILCPGGTCGSFQNNMDFSINDIKIGTHQDSLGFNIEVFLPFQDHLEKSATWKANVFYINRLENSTTEYCSWATYPKFGFHQPAYFGILKFE